MAAVDIAVTHCVSKGTLQHPMHQQSNTKQWNPCRAISVWGFKVVMMLVNQPAA
jgi:hypothetical protein